MRTDFAEMYQTTVLFTVSLLVLFLAPFVFLVPFDYPWELVSFLGVKRSRGRAHLTTLRERRRSPAATGRLAPQNLETRGRFWRCVMEESRVREEFAGFLRDCLVEGDSTKERGERRNKRRALLISIILQILVLTGLVVIPLLSKGENIANRAVYVPAVPYSPGNTRNSGKTPPHQQRRTVSSSPRFFEPSSIPPTISTRDDHPSSVDDRTSSDDVGIPGAPEGKAIPGAPPAIGTRIETPPPPPPPQQRLRLSEAVIAARLIRRVQPVYPTLAIQIRREGRVELHAIISSDGSIESLEVVTGDPVFIQSALSAVRQWRYQPTLLNGQPIEVDTHITVIYTLSH
jgi:periplasmic protein TonB